jgi:hypothetical protein
VNRNARRAAPQCPEIHSRAAAWSAAGHLLLLQTDPAVRPESMDGTGSGKTVPVSLPGAVNGCGIDIDFSRRRMARSPE